MLQVQEWSSDRWKSLLFLEKQGDDSIHTNWIKLISKNTDAKKIEWSHSEPERQVSRLGHLLPQKVLHKFPKSNEGVNSFPNHSPAYILVKIWTFRICLIINSHHSNWRQHLKLAIWIASHSHWTGSWVAGSRGRDTLGVVINLVQQISKHYFKLCFVQTDLVLGTHNWCLK